jgi:hypothetical protein
MSHAPAVATQAPAVAHAGGVHAVAPAHAPAEREADRFAESFASADPGPAWSFGEMPVHAGDGARLETGLEARLGAALDADLSAVRVHQDSDAADLAQRAGAEAVTIGHDISFAPGKHQPGTREGVRRLAHEVAHTARHADGRLAHRDGTGPVTPATTLAGLDAADRKRIQVVTTTAISAPTKEELKDKYFDKGTTLNPPSDTTVALDKSVSAGLAKGLTNLASDWSTGTDPALAPNSTFTLALDLTAQGGAKAPFRFTFNLPPAAAGKKAEGRILVEQLGAAAPPAGATKPADPKEGEAKPADPVAAKMTAASITHSGFSKDEEQALRAAIALVPDKHLALVSGLTFARQLKNKGDPKVAGKYFPKDDSTQGVAKANTIVLYDNAFSSSAVVFVEGGTATSYTSREILHEIGHAVDLRGLQKSYEGLETATAGVNAASGTFTSADDKKKYDAAVTAESTAKKTLKDYRTASGTQTIEKPLAKGEKPDPSKPKEYVDVIGAATTAFRDAVKADGKNVSKYAEKDWQDSFAEAYSLYLSSPSELLLLRPATHAYFVKAYPK